MVCFLATMFVCWERTGKGCDIQRCNVIFKTHLDVGFTDWGSKVIVDYLYSIILFGSFKFVRKITKDSLLPDWLSRTCGSWLSELFGKVSKWKWTTTKGSCYWPGRLHLYRGVAFTMQVELCVIVLSAALNISKTGSAFWPENDCRKITMYQSHEGAIVLKRRGFSCCM